MDHRESNPSGRLSIGNGAPVFICAEIGINHNGSLELAKKMIDGAVRAGCDAVKFQKRTPELCVPRHQRGILRETPWGVITYLEYKKKIEFHEAEFREIDSYCRERNILWFASCWDTPSVRFISKFDSPLYKIPSALITDRKLLSRIKQTGKPIMISTGMSTMEEIEATVRLLDEEGLMIAHSTSAYPCVDEELNLRMIVKLQMKFPRAIIGYSGHEVGLPTTLAAVALGANFIERHITLDRAMWGTDQAASVEIHGLEMLVRNIRCVEKSLGDGVKRVYESEMAVRNKLRPNRRVNAVPFRASVFTRPSIRHPKAATAS
jgi:N-acetylneuraminate synthase